VSAYQEAAEAPEAPWIEERVWAVEEDEEEERGVVVEEEEGEGQEEGEEWGGVGSAQRALPMHLAENAARCIPPPLSLSPPQKHLAENSARCIGSASMSASENKSLVLPLENKSLQEGLGLVLGLGLENNWPREGKQVVARALSLGGLSLGGESRHAENKFSASLEGTLGAGNAYVVREDVGGHLVASEQTSFEKSSLSPEGTLRARNAGSGAGNACEVGEGSNGAGQGWVVQGGDKRVAAEGWEGNKSPRHRKVWLKPPCLLQSMCLVCP
jgi:hypothetical protein